MYYDCEPPTTNHLPRERETKLMRRWRARKDVKARNEVVEHYLGFAASLVFKIAGRGPFTDDLISAANRGLMAAVNSYDPDRGVRFGSYARSFIRGHVLRALRAKSRTDMARIDPLDSTVTDEDGEVHVVGVVDPPTDLSVDAAVLRIDIEGALKVLPPRTAKVMRGVYWEDRSFADIGREIGLTRERVRVIHDGAVAVLRGRLK